MKSQTSRPSTNANSRQVGGDHYESPMQHWDFVWINNLDYFQGQITKYVSRHWRKNGVEDLLKARHFLDKYIELLQGQNAKTEVASDNFKLASEVKEWRGFTFEAAKDGMFHYRCQRCKEMIHVREGDAPIYDHDCPLIGKNKAYPDPSAVLQTLDAEIPQGGAESEDKNVGIVLPDPADPTARGYANQD